MNSGRIIAILQARTGSQRLPGKVLMPIGECSLLERVVERIQRMHMIDDFVVATSVSKGDDKIADLCQMRGWNCFRGPERDVLERYLRAAQAMRATDIVRITADCPLFSWQEADRLIAHALARGSDYAHNLTCWGSGMPIGTGVEVMTIEALGAAWIYGLEAHHREHVTEYIFEHPERFKIELQRAPAELDRPGYRLTVDTSADLDLIRCIQARLAPTGGLVELAAAIEWLDAEPALARSNLEPERKAS